MALVAPVSGYMQRPTPDAVNTFDYLDISNQAAGIGTIASPLTGDNEVWSDVNTSNMSKRNQFRAAGYLER